MGKSRNCSVCQSSMISTAVEHPYWHENTLVALVRDVPSWVCELCGHRYFDPAVETTLQHIAKEYIKLGQTYPIPTAPYRALAVKTN